MLCCKCVRERKKEGIHKKAKKPELWGGKKKRKKEEGINFETQGKIALKRKAATKAKLGRGGFEMDQAFVFYVTSAGGEVGLCLQRS